MDGLREEDCVLGIIGRPVLLPCFYPQLLTSVNVSIEWRQDDQVVLNAMWRDDGDVVEWSINRASVSAEALLTGNISLELPSVDPVDNNKNYRVFIISGDNQSAALCSVCLRIAASFSFPLLRRGEAAQGNKTFLCQSGGGFPEPAVHWLIDNTAEPPEGSVKTLITSLPDSKLFNITSRLTVNVSKDSSVSCIIENPAMNKTVTATTYGADGSPVVSRASEAMWIFSTILCVVVGVMVIVGVGYQIHLDRISKRKKKEYQYQQTHANRGYKRGSPNKEEMEAMKPDKKETDV
ncbi:ICOS ligand-like [Tautogolabrus adspersus]